MEAQHHRVEELIAELTAALPRWEAEARPAVGEELASTFDTLRVALLEHLADEEEHILPIAARCVTQEEWNSLGEHGMAKVDRSQLPVLFGAMLEEATPEERTMIFARPAAGPAAGADGLRLAVPALHQQGPCRLIVAARRGRETGASARPRPRPVPLRGVQLPTYGGQPVVGALPTGREGHRYRRGLGGGGSGREEDGRQLEQSASGGQDPEGRKGVDQGPGRADLGASSAASSSWSRATSSAPVSSATMACMLSTTPSVNGSLARRAMASDLGQDHCAPGPGCPPGTRADPARTAPGPA